MQLNIKKFYKMITNILVKDVKEFLTGNLRYYIYYKISPKLIPTHIREQYEARIKSMDKKCYNDGQCKLCGCKTTALQFADKACDKPCYPAMMNSLKWNILKSGCKVYCSKTKLWWVLNNNKFAVRNNNKTAVKSECNK